MKTLESKDTSLKNGFKNKAINMQKEHSLSLWAAGGICLVVSLITIGLYLYSLYFVQPVSDDYTCYNLHNTLSMGGFVQHFMSTQPGRLFVFIYFYPFQNEYCCIIYPGLGIFFIVLFFFVSLWIFMTTVLFFKKKGAWKKGLLFAWGVFAAYWSVEQNPGELFYWLSATFTYLPPVSICLLLMAFCRWYTVSPQTKLKQRGLWLFFPVSLLLLTAIEIITLYFFCFMLLLFIISLYQRSPHKYFWLWMLLISGFSLAFIVFNPGSFARLSVYDTSIGFEAVQRLLLKKDTYLNTVAYVWNWFFSPPILLLCVLIYVTTEKDFFSITIPPKVSVLALALVATVTLIGMFLLVLSLGGINYRVWSFLHIIFYIGIVTVWCGVRCNFTSHDRTSKGIASLILVLMSIFLLFSNTNMMMLNDIREGRFRRFHAERSFRIKKINEAVASGKLSVQIPSYTDRPTFFYGYFDDANLSNTYNEMAKYYGLEAITLTHKTSASLSSSK